MSREYKFRAWIHEQCGGGVPQERFNTMAYSDDDSLEDFFSQFENFFEVMQSTEYQDKNSNLLYEDDIVKSDNIKGVVRYDDETAAYMVEVDANTHYNLFNLTTIERIGNIHENPELV